MEPATEPATNPTKNFLTEGADLLLKLASATLATLYVAGLLVSNLQLMQLGVADFSSLQVRNVMTGTLFFFYVLLLLPILALPVTVVSIALRKSAFTKDRLITADTGTSRTLITSALFMSMFKKHKLIARVLALGGVLLAGVIGETLLAAFIGTLFGFFYPWGMPWHGYFFSRAFWDPVSWTSDTVTGIRQFLDTYRYPKTIAAAVGITYLWLFFSLVRRGVSENVSGFQRIRSIVFDSKYALAGYAAYCLAALLLLLISFANDVYPNIRSNLGGGQPQVAELEMKAERAGIMLPGIAMCLTTNGEEQFLLSKPVAIWSQTDKFLYVTPLPLAPQNATELVALDINMVRSVRYLRKYVRVESGGHIRDVASY